MSKKLSNVPPKSEDKEFELDNSPTEMVSADDILEAVGGIDGWDSVPDELGLNDSSNRKSLLDNMDIDADDTLTTVFKAPQNADDLPVIKGGETATPSAAKPKSNSVELPDIPALRRGDKSGIAIPPSSQTNLKVSGRSPSDSIPKVSIAPLPKSVEPASETSATIAIKVDKAKLDEALAKEAEKVSEGVPVSAPADLVNASNAADVADSLFSDKTTIGPAPESPHANAESNETVAIVPPKIPETAPAVEAPAEPEPTNAVEPASNPETASTESAEPESDYSATMAIELPKTQEAAQAAEEPAQSEPNVAIEQPSVAEAVPTAVPEAPAASDEQAAKPVPTPPPAPPVSTEAAPAVNSEPAPEQEMSDEEQFEALLAQMTEEERAAYEAHSMEQEELARERDIQKQRDIYEMYGQTTEKQSIPAGVYIVGLLVIAAFAGLIYWILNTDHVEQKAEETVAKQEKPVEEERVYERAPALDTYSIKLDLKNVSLLYINGVEKPVGAASYEFVSGHRNSIMAFGDGRVPYFKTFDGRTQVTDTIQIDLEPDTLWQKGSVKFRPANAEQLAGNDVKITFDGHTVRGLDSVVEDVVLGRPHVIIIRKPGLGSHMHLIWPDDRESTVHIPELSSAEIAKGGSRCYVKLPPASGKSVGIKIYAGGQEYNSDAVVTLLPDGMVEYYIDREQRHPLQLAVIPPDEFGTLALDTSLLRNSIGRAIVYFKRPPNSTFQVCMRRSGELICPDMTKETEVPSGPDWEFLAAEGSEGNWRLIRGTQIQDLVKDRKYGFDVRTDRGVFSLKQATFARLKGK